MRIELQRARIVDPLHEQNGKLASLFIEDGKFVSALTGAKPAERTIDLDGKYVLAGGIDLHTHIGGGKVNLARLLMPAAGSSQGGPVWPTLRTGQLYNQMGYTACFEPAMMLSGARHTHLELADTPGLDTGAYVVLGNEDWLLQALAEGAHDGAIDAIVGWSVTASRALAVKVVNAGGINAFKYGQRSLAVDQPHAHWGVTPRQVIARLSASVERIGLEHPLHVHASNLGMPGNVQAALDTLAAAEGHRIHLTHAQFNAYTAEGPYGMGSGAELLARYVNEHPNVSLDVGQVVFGQTVTISADAAAQYRNRRHARPNRWVVSDVECQAGCGVVPMRYEDKQYVHSLQWSIGLELMLLIEDPWRVFLTTDHPNGGPFTSYPHLLRLLMDRSFRQSMLETIHPRAAENSLLRELTREYTLDEVAIITRAAPARILGLHDRGRLSPGAIADVAVYPQRDNWEATFERASLVMKCGTEVVQDGVQLASMTDCRTLFAEPRYDNALMEQLGESVEQRLHVPWRSLEISLNEIQALMRTGSAVSSPSWSSGSLSPRPSSPQASASGQAVPRTTEGAG
ncbi:MAG: formylmethanofuran dehydrogenase subunit A [Pirellulaceae bacterium]